MTLLKTIVFLKIMIFGLSTENPIPYQKGWTTIDQNEYLIQHPDYWVTDKSGQMGTNLILFSNLSSDKDKFRENVTIIIQDLTGMGLNLDNYVEISESQIKTLATEGSIHESTRLNKGQTPFHKISYTFKQGIFLLKVEQYYYIRNQKAYVVTFTAEANQFDNYKNIGERILNSFKLKS